MGSRQYRNYGHHNYRTWTTSISPVLPRCLPVRCHRSDARTLTCCVRLYIRTYDWKLHETLNRLVIGRLPATVMTCLNIATRLSGVIIELIVAGQISSAVIAFRVFSTSVMIIVVSATLSAIVVVIGNKHLDFNYTLFARGLVMFILASVVDCSKHSPTTPLLSAVRVQDKHLFDRRISFASLCIARTMTYAPFAMQRTKSDSSSNKNVLIFIQSLLTHLPGFGYTFVIGAVMGEMTGVIVAWQEAYTRSTCSVLAEIL